MPGKTLLIGCNPGTNVWGSTAYQSIGSAYTWSFGEAAGAQTLFRSAGVMSDMYLFIGTNTRAVTSTFTFRKNAGNGNETLSIAATTTGALHDTTHTETVAAGDFLDMSINAVATTTIAVAVQANVFTSTTETNTRLSVFTWGGGAYTVASTTNYFPIVGYDTNVAHDATESHSKCRQRKAGTFKNLAVQPGTNSSTNATSYKGRKNGADGTIVVSIPGSSTGWVEDTTHSDAVAAGDDYNYSITTGSGTCNIRGEINCIDFDSINSDCQLAQAMQSGTDGFGGNGAALAANITTYGCLEGENILNTTETQMQTAALFTSVMSELTTVLSTNTVTAGSTLKFRKNAGNGTLVVSITASTTGVFSDSVHTDAVVATDLCTQQVITGATGTSATFTSFSIWANTTTLTNVPLTETTSISESKVRKVIPLLAKRVVLA